MMFRSSVLVLVLGSLLAGCGARPLTSKSTSTLASKSTPKSAPKSASGARLASATTASATTASATASASPSGSPSPTVNLDSGIPDINSAEPLDGTEILLWATQGENGPMRTFYLAAEGGLRILRQSEGATIVTSHGELTWKTEKKELKLKGCEHADGSPRTPSTGVVMNAKLVKSNGQVAQKVVDFYDGGFGSEPDIDELGHFVTLTGSIGPYLFIREGSYSYACGMHGSATAASMVWDANAGKKIDLDSELANADKLAATAKQKLDEIDNDQGAPENSEDPGLARFIPVYSEHGALRIDVQFARSACYACGDGQWGSYTRSAIVPTNWFPERMKAWSIPPVVVKEFAKAHRDWQIGGWSKR